MSSDCRAEQEHFQALFQAAKDKFRQRVPRSARASSAASASSPVRAFRATATSPSSSHASASVLLTARSRPECAPIRRGSVKSMLRMCAREQLGNDLRRAVRDLICDGNFDGRDAPRYRLDFEILVTPSTSESPRKTFLIERKSYSDLLASHKANDF